MKTKEEIASILAQAKEMGMESVEVDGVKYTLGAHPVTKQLGFPQELKPEEMVTPLSVLDEYTEEEILYWSSGYFDDLQARKESANKQRAIDDELKQERVANG